MGRARRPRPSLDVHLADDPDAFGSLYALRYYGALSYAAFDGSEPIVTGSWPVDSNPLRVDLHR
jgi:hypothetical protein